MAPLIEPRIPEHYLFVSTYNAVVGLHEFSRRPLHTRELDTTWVTFRVNTFGAEIPAPGGGSWFLWLGARQQPAKLADKPHVYACIPQEINR